MRVETDKRLPPGALEPFALMIIVPHGRWLGREAVRISYGPQHQRKPHRNDQQIEAQWAAALSANHHLFDGSKFRLQRIQWVDETQMGIEVSIGLTSYKEYLGTHRISPDDRAILVKDGLLHHADRDAHFSRALGCEALLVTADEQVVLLRRSCATATHSGLYNGPSGHPEPSSAGISVGDLPRQAAGVGDGGGPEIPGSAEVANDSDSASTRVRDELFNSIVDETHAETNVPREALSVPRLMGVMCDSTGKPDLLFYLRTSLSAAEVKSQYAQGAAEGWESDHLAFVALSSFSAMWEAPSLILDKPEENPVLPLTCVTRAAIACYLGSGSTA